MIPKPHLSLAAALLFAAGPALAQGAAGDLSGGPVAGGEFAEVVRSARHEIPGRQPILRAPGAMPFQALAADPSVTGMALQAFLTGPHRTMPNIVLTRGQLYDIISYILSLKGQ